MHRQPYIAERETGRDGRLYSHNGYNYYKKPLVIKLSGDLSKYKCKRNEVTLELCTARWDFFQEINPTERPKDIILASSEEPCI